MRFEKRNLAPTLNTRVVRALSKPYLTLSGLQAQHGLSYSRLNRAVRALKKAGLISTWRGERNELRIDESHALLITHLVRLLRKDYGLEKAIAFLELQQAKAMAKELRAVCRQLQIENEELKRELAEVQPESFAYASHSARAGLPR